MVKKIVDLKKFKNSWKLRLRYGRLKTNLKSVVILVNCENKKGSAWASMPMWIESHEQAFQMANDAVRSLGYLPLKFELFEKPDTECPPSKIATITGEIKLVHYKK